MAQTNGGIGNVTPNAGLVEMAMAYSRSCTLCAAARLGIAKILWPFLLNHPRHCLLDLCYKSVFQQAPSRLAVIT